MDLRGFSADNAGVIYELNELINVMPVARIVLLVDRTTDIAFLKETLKHCWSNMRPDSPNRGISKATLTACEVAAERQLEVAHVLQSLSAAVRRGKS